MARRLYNSEYYSQSASQDTSTWALPIRWMAPESYTDGTWDMKSDVWMFGVMLWGMSLDCSVILMTLLTEIFTWAALPWAELDDKAVIPALQRRRKLEHPGEMCPDVVYETMLGCWKLGEDEDDE